jgi:hypothetical protein
MLSLSLIVSPGAWETQLENTIPTCALNIFRCQFSPHRRKWLRTVIHERDWIKWFSVVPTARGRRRNGP